jgi:hypothetical protein
MNEGNHWGQGYNKPTTGCSAEERPNKRPLTFHPRTGHKGSEGEQRFRSSLSLTSLLDGGRWWMPQPGRFTPRKVTRYPLYMRLSGSQGQSGRVGKIAPPPPPGIRSHVRPARSESLYRLLSKVPKIKETFFLIPHCVMIRFPSFRKITVCILRVTNVSSGCWSDTEDELCQLFSLLQHWKIVRGFGFVVGQWEFRFVKTPGVALTPTGCGKSYYLFIPNTLKPPYITHTFLSLCHMSIHMKEIQSLSRWRQLVCSS